MRIAALATASLGFACQAQNPSNGAEPVPRSSMPTVEGSHESADPIDRDWSVRFRYPLVVGYSDFELGEGQALDSLATLALVPTADFIRPLSEEWTLIPFLGLGAGWLLNDDVGVVILTTGVRAVWARSLEEATVLRVLPRLRYDANLNRPDGLLGDWGRVDVAVELRHALGIAGEEMRVEPGVYAQALWFWDDVDFDVPGLAPDSVQKQLELGLSLGTREPIEILGFDLPRVFVGVRFGDGVETITLRFGEL